jgi:rifampicin phosphotransferase
MASSEWIVDTAPSVRLPVYTRMNANDVLSDPISPLGASLVWIPNILPGWANAYAGTGAFSAAEVSEPASVCGFFYGHLYVNMSATRLFGLRSGAGVETVDTIWFGGHPDIPPYVAQPGDENEEMSARVAAFAQWALTATEYPDLEEDRVLSDRLRRERRDLAAMSDAALVARARSVGPYERLVWRGEVFGGLAGAIAPGVLGQLLGPHDPSLIIQIIGHGGDVDSAAPAFALWDLSRLVRDDAALAAEFDAGVEGLSARLRDRHPDFAARFEEFIAEFGYRGPNEWDIVSDTWETRPELALGLIERLRTLGPEADPHERARNHAVDADAAMARAESFMGDDEAALATLRTAVASARRAAGWRERGKANCIKVLHEARVAMVILGRRLYEAGHLDHPGQLFMALDSELDALLADPASLRSTLAEREHQWTSLVGLQLPLFIDTSKELPTLESLTTSAAATRDPLRAGESLCGVGASAGKARGRANVVLATDAVSAFEQGDILVAPQTDPSWTPLFVLAAAVVVDVGAANSHAMIVSRELGIPCVAGVTGATSRIPDGSLIEIDGSTGTVTVLEPVAG